MTGKSYGHFCGLAHAMDLIGERWALMVVRELVFGPKRYTDLLAGIPGVSTNILAARLVSLEENQIVTKRLLPPPLGVTIYELTPYGRELEPIMFQLLRWGAKTISLSSSDPMRSNWLGLALKAYFQPDPTLVGERLISLVLSTGNLTITLRPDGLQVSEQSVERSELKIFSSEKQMILLMAGRLSLQDACKKKFRWEGDEALLSAFLRGLAISHD